MEEKDVNNIASAVTSALAKLNTDTTAKEKEKESDTSNMKPETFKCPECGGEVAGGTQYCINCGCELEWEE